MKETSLYDSNESVRIPRKKKTRTGVCFKQQGKSTPNKHSKQRYCVIYKKAGITEQNYMSHNSEDCFGKIYNQKSINGGMGGPMGIRTEDVKQYKRPKNKWKKELKYLKKKKIISRIAKKSRSRRELKKINKLKDKDSSKHCDSSSDSYRDYCDSPLSRNSDSDEYR